MAPPLPDLVRDSKLVTRHDSGHVVHSYTETSHNRRRIIRQEAWKWERDLGHGSFGQVWLEQCVSGNSTGQMRAVKMVRKQANSANAIDFNRELEAVAKFSHARVSGPIHDSVGPARSDAHCSTRPVCEVIWLVR